MGNLGQACTLLDLLRSECSNRKEAQKLNSNVLITVHQEGFLGLLK